MNRQTKLLIVDGMGVFRRVFEAMPESAKAGDEGVEGIRKSCLSSLSKAIRQTTPTHILVALEGSGKTWRHEIFPAYKSDRKPTPEPLSVALEGIKSSLSDAGLCYAGVDGYEADDVIASVAQKADESVLPMDICIITRDKDLTALVNESITIHDHFKEKSLNSFGVLDKYGVSPERMHDFLALKGDRSDSIPGAKGIGDKTAIDLINQFPDIPAMIGGTARMNPAYAKKIKASENDIVISRKLVSFKTDFSIGCSLSAMAVSRDITFS